MHRSTRHLLRAAAVALTAVTVVATAATGAPASALVPNDDVAAALPVASLPFTSSVDLRAATTEPDEPLTACDFVSNTVWYALRLPTDTVVRLDTAGSTTDTAVAVFDDPSLHEPIACSGANGDSPQAAVRFQALAGVEYLVQVGADTQTGVPVGTLVLSADVAPRPTGKPDVSGARYSSTFAGAFFHDEVDGGWTSTQVDVSQQTGLLRGQLPERGVDVMFASRRSVTGPDGVGHNDEWFFAGPVDPAHVRVSQALNGASAELELTVQRSRCVVTTTGEPECTDLPDEHVTVTATWTGVGEVHRDRIVLADRGFGHLTGGTAHDAWRATEVTATVTGDLEQRLSEPFDAVLSRSALNATSWTRG